VRYLIALRFSQQYLAQITVRLFNVYSSVDETKMVKDMIDVNEENSY
jgi:hypothetical protein